MKQMLGIPMGDPLSPGMTIGACAWMENKFLNSIPSDSKDYFRAKRYMDDVIAIISNDSTWDRVQFMNSFATCYDDPLKLEKAEPNIFLETEFTQFNNEVSHRLKNVNAKQPGKVCRYLHFHSYGDYTQKRTTLLSTLRKVHKYASDDAELFESAIDKLMEFKILKYPKGILRYMCAIMARDNSSMIWRQVRQMV